MEIQLMSTYSKIEKYLHPIKLPLVLLFNGVKKIYPPKFFKEKLRWVKGFFQKPFSFLGITLYINFQGLWRFCVLSLKERTGTCITGIISVTLFIIFLPFPFLKSLPEEESFSSLETFPEFFLATPSENLFLVPTNKFLAESPNFLLVEKNSLRSATPPSLISSQVLGALLLGEYPQETPKKVIREYIVESEETLSSLAAQFEISLNTILWANNLTEKSIIKPGQKLVIPPVSGVIYHVKSGDTLSEIVKTYKGKMDEIVAFNDLSNEHDIYVGDILIIPDGELPPPAKAQPRPSIIPLVDSQFILPVSSPYMITQGLHWYNAVDLSHPGYACRKPVFAVAGGQVQKTGYDNSYGNYVRILHPNDVVTLYAHLSVITVENDAKVNVGEIIGYIGNTGYTRGLTGCHLHFEVRGAKNPFSR